MPLGLPNPNPSTPSPRRPSSNTRSSGGSSTPTPTPAPTTGSPYFAGSSVLGGGVQQGPVAPGTMPSRNSPYSGFQASPEYSNVGAWGGWDQAAPQSTQDFGSGVLGETFNAVSGGAVDLRETNRQYYERMYGKDAVNLAMRSGMDPAVYFSSAPAVQQMAQQWGTNIGNARGILDQQQGAYDARSQQQAQTNSYIDEFGNLQTYMQDNLLSQYLSGSAMADARYGLGQTQLEQGLATDLGLLGERRYRDVNLGQADNAAALLHNANMRGVLDETRGIRGESYKQQQGYLNQQTGFLNDRQRNAYSQFQSTDQYGAQQAQDLIAQYGFAGRQFDQEVQDAFANRSTSQRAAASDAAARGAFGSSGFGDNISDIYGQYQRSTDASTLGLDRTNEGLDVRGRDIGQQRKDLRIGYEGQQIGFRQDAAGINDAQARNTLGYRDDLANYRGQYSANDKERTQLLNVDKGLSSLAKEYGIKEQDLRNGFNNAITKMGLDLQDTQQQLEQMLNSGNAQLMAQGMTFMQQMMAYQ